MMRLSTDLKSVAVRIKKDETEPGLCLRLAWRISFYYYYYFILGYSGPNLSWERPPGPVPGTKSGPVQSPCSSFTLLLIQVLSSPLVPLHTQSLWVRVWMTSQLLYKWPFSHSSYHFARHIRSENRLCFRHRPPCSALENY